MAGEFGRFIDEKRRGRAADTVTGSSKTSEI